MDELAPVSESTLLPIARELARLRVAETSLRNVAREIGMSPGGLKGCLDGSDPLRKTLEKLRAWVARVRGLGEASPEVAENTILALLRGLPDPHGGASEVINFMADLHRRQNVDVPEWTTAARARVAQSLRRLGR
jgi:AcrR family transcriptional regulator